MALHPNAPNGVSVDERANGNRLLCDHGGAFQNVVWENVWSRICGRRSNLTEEAFTVALSLDFCWKQECQSLLAISKVISLDCVCRAQPWEMKYCPLGDEEQGWSKSQASQLREQTHNMRGIYMGLRAVPRHSVKKCRQRNSLGGSRELFWMDSYWEHQVCDRLSLEIRMCVG